MKNKIKKPNTYQTTSIKHLKTKLALTYLLLPTLLALVPICLFWYYNQNAFIFLILLVVWAFSVAAFNAACANKLAPVTYFHLGKEMGLQVRPFDNGATFRIMYNNCQLFNHPTLHMKIARSMMGNKAGFGFLMADVSCKDVHEVQYSDDGEEPLEIRTSITYKGSLIQIKPPSNFNFEAWIVSKEVAEKNSFFKEEPFNAQAIGDFQLLLKSSWIAATTAQLKKMNQLIQQLQQTPLKLHGIQIARSYIVIAYKNRNGILHIEDQPNYMDSTYSQSAKSRLNVVAELLKIVEEFHHPTQPE